MQSLEGTHTRLPLIKQKLLLKNIGQKPVPQSWEKWIMGTLKKTYLGPKKTSEH